MEPLFLNFFNFFSLFHLIHCENSFINKGTLFNCKSKPYQSKGEYVLNHASPFHYHPFFCNIICIYALVFKNNCSSFTVNQRDRQVLCRVTHSKPLLLV